MTPLKKSPTTQSDVLKHRDADSRLVRWMTVGLFLGTLLAYLLTLTKNYYWDGIFFAQVIEDAPKLNASLLHPNHLLDNVFEYFVYRAVRVAGFNVRALTALQLSNCVFGATSACLMFRICLDCFKSKYVSIILALLFAFSATWWKFCTDADSYILAVLFLLICLYLILPGRKPRPFAVAGAHALAMFVHQLSAFFFPVALVGIILQTRSTERRLRPALKYLIAVVLITTPVYYYSFYLVSGSLSVTRFASWTTSFSPENGFTFNLWSNLVYSLRSQWRVLLGGRVSFLRDLWGPGIISLTSILLALAAVFFYKLIRYFKELKRESVDAQGGRWQLRSLTILCGIWIIPYLVFLFFFIPQNTFYRLFYLPPIILLAGILLARYEGSPVHIRRYRAALLAAVVFAANLTFSAYPYSLVRANPPTGLALKMNAVWKQGTIIYFASRDADNALVRYFNPSTTWIEAEPETLDKQISQVETSTRKLWLDTTLIDRYEATPEGRIWLNQHTVCPPESQLVNRKYKIRFCEIQPASFAR